MLIRLKIADIRFEMGQQAHFSKGNQFFFVVGNYIDRKL